MTSKTFAIKNLFNTSFLTTREAAQEIFERADENDFFDFSGIEFASSSFADEFLSQLETRDLALNQVARNINPNLEKLFQAVQRRRRSRVSA